MLTFKGGVHPPEGKELSEEQAIKTLDIPSQVIIPLSQHIGAPAKAVVSVGDVVKTGQKIGDASGNFSATVHSSVTGKVIAIGKYPHPVLGTGDAIVIERTGEDAWFEYPKHADYSGLSRDALLGIIAEMGIVGMGGATFPTHIKLNPPEWKKAEYLIINAAECEPYLTCDDRMMREQGEGVIEGLKIMMKVSGALKGVIGIEHNKPHAIAHMKKLCASEQDISVAVVQTKYPQGAEKQLIYAITKRAVPNGGLPIDAGCIVQNVGTAYAVYDAVVQGRPLIERAVTVSGEAMTTPSNFLARIGDTYDNLIKKAGGMKDNTAKVISGGPMMGFAQFTVEGLPVTKGTSGILAFPASMVKCEEELACISCSSCVDVCPMKLLPTTLASNVKYKQFEQVKKLNVISCIECGSCSFVCPAKIPLIQYMRIGKNEVRKILAKERQKEEVKK